MKIVYLIGVRSLKKWLLKTKPFFIICCVGVLTSCSLAPGQQLILNGSIPSPSKQQPVKIIRIDQSLMHHPQYLVPLSPYEVGPQDILNIVVWDHPELTIPAGAYRTPAESGIEINRHGNIFYPFVGSIHVSGKTVDEIRDLLTKKLAKNIRNPQISVRVAQFNSKKIQVLGEVKQPTVEPINNQGLSVMEAINKAGGMNPMTANPMRVFVIRAYPKQNVVYVLNADDPSALLVAEHFYLKNQDVIFVAPAGIASWNRVMANLVPSVSAAYDLDRIISNR